MAELELQHYQVNVVYLGFMNQYFICVQLIKQVHTFLLDSWPWPTGHMHCNCMPCTWWPIVCSFVKNTVKKVHSFWFLSEKSSQFLRENTQNSLQFCTNTCQFCTNITLFTQKYTSFRSKHGNLGQIVAILGHYMGNMGPCEQCKTS